MDGPVKPGHDEWSGSWERDLSTVALPTLMKKILQHAVSDDRPLFRHARSARKR